MTEPSQSSREIAEEIRQSAKDFGFRQWVKDCDFAIHLAECLDVSYNMGRAYERGVEILDTAALRQRADEATRAENEACEAIARDIGSDGDMAASLIAAAIRARITPKDKP